MSLVNYYIEADDDTYIYGDNMFQCKYCEETREYKEPFIYKENTKKIVKYYRSKCFFVIYEDNEITDIIKVMTCWSDDYVHYKIKNRFAYIYDENYHGRPYERNKECNIDFNDFIMKHNL
jgi:hypothetical protein